MYAHDRRTFTERAVECGLQRALQIAGVFACLRALQRDSAIVENGDVRRRKPGHAGGDERADPADCFARELRAGPHPHAHAGAGVARGFVGELGGFRRRDDDARVVEPVDAAQSGFDIPG